MTTSLVVFVHPSVCPQRNTRLPPEGYSWNFIFGIVTENCRYVPIFLSRVKIKDVSIYVTVLNYEARLFSVRHQRRSVKKVKIEASRLFRETVCTGKRRVRPLRDIYRKYDISLSTKELQEIGQGPHRPEK